MKKFYAFFIVCLLMFLLVACGSNTTPEEASTTQANESLSKPTQETQEPTEAPELSETEIQSETLETEVPSEAADTSIQSLVVYFSWSGNTENVANEIASQTGSDIFEIVPQIPYTDDYDAVVDLAQQEQSDNVRPEIAEAIENIDEYDIIYVGFPNWWGDMPMILFTFFDTYDLSGKTIAPFCTSGGSGLSNTVSEIKSLEPEAIVTDGLHIGSGAANNPTGKVTDWLQSIDLYN